MPIIGGYGNASEYAYRSFIIDFPNPFDWIDLYNVEPGVEYRAGYAKITGIKSPLPLRVSIGSSFSLISNVFDNQQTVTFDNNDKNQASFDEYTSANNRFQPGLGFNNINDFVKNNQSINLAIIIPKSEKTDFNKTYTTNVSVGKSEQDWIVQTRPIDETPNPFSFTSIASTSTSTFSRSGSIVISDFEPGFSFDAEIISGIGTLSINNVSRGTLYEVSNGDDLEIYLTSSNLFETSESIVLQVGTYTTTWSVTTEIENLDVTFTPTDFDDQSNRQLNTDYNSNQLTISGLSLNSDLPVTLTSGSYEVERGGSVIKSFTDNPIEVVNNDKIRLRLRSSSSYSSNVSTTMTVGNTSADWKITTRDPPPPPPPVTPFVKIEHIFGDDENTGDPEFDKEEGIPSGISLEIYARGKDDPGSTSNRTGTKHYELIVNGTSNADLYNFNDSNQTASGIFLSDGIWLVEYMPYRYPDSKNNRTIFKYWYRRNDGIRTYVRSHEYNLSF